MKRALLVTVGIAAILFLCGAIAWWLFISAWVPTKGKALLIRTLEQPGTVTVSIHSLQYRPFHGVEATEVQIVERATGTTLVHAPMMVVGVQWLPFLATRECVFRAEGLLILPCETSLTLAGRYALRDKTLRMDLRSGDIPLAGVREPLRRHLPAPLSNGTVRLALHVVRRPEAPVTVSGRVAGRRVVWSSPALRVTGDLAVDGQAVLATPTQPWSLEAAVTLQDGTLDQVQQLPPITHLEGTARLTQDRLALTRLTGEALGSPWRLEGELAFHPLSVELLLTSQAQLAPISETLSPVHAQWKVAGTSDLRIACRGPLQPAPLLDCVGTADIQGGTLTGAQPAPLVTGMTGRLRYDHLARELTITGLEGLVMEKPVTADGTLRYGRPGELLRLTAAFHLPQGQGTVNARLTSEQLVIEEATVALTDTAVRLTGQLARDPQRPSTLAARGTIECAELSQVPFVAWPGLEPWKLQGLVTFDARFEGPLADWRTGTLDARLRAEQLRIREVPLEQVRCDVEQRDRTFRIRMPSVVLANGRGLGEFIMQHRDATSDYVLQADLVGVDLARLAEVIPAWRARTVRGTASTHLMLVGTWQSRATWGGEGWLNASGEQLGDVPFLDKVLRGMFGVLGDRLGLDVLRRAQITQISGRWRLLQERVRTDDLRIGAMAGSEPVALYAQGSVGLDQTLDFTIEPELSENTVLQAPSTSTVASTVLKAAGRLDQLRRLVGRHRLTGTLKDPHYRFEFGTGELLKQVAPGPSDLLQGLLDSLRQ